MKCFDNTSWMIILLCTVVGIALAHHKSEDTIIESRDDKQEEEEYKELKAELAAYTSVLRQLERQAGNRRSMSSTACWKKGGICIEKSICSNSYDTQVPGCMGMGSVCCYMWNTIAMNPKFMLPGSLSGAQPYYSPHQNPLPQVVSPQLLG